MTIKFEKYEGLGNDFVIVELSDARGFPEELVSQLCDRHFGIGADGVLLVVPSDREQVRAKMLVLNADGSRPEMCGNGLRCVALHLANKDTATAIATLTIESPAGEHLCEVVLNATATDGEVSGLVTLGMGLPELLEPLRVAFEGQVHTFHRLSLGNPHAVLFGPELPSDFIDRLAPVVSASVPGGCNIGFATRAGSTFRLVVWERGVGRTLACGTGACAAVAVAVSERLVPREAWIRVLLPGGALEVQMSAAGGLLLRGPARRVFRGEF